MTYFKSQQFNRINEDVTVIATGSGEAVLSVRTHLFKISLLNCLFVLSEDHFYSAV